MAHLTFLADCYNPLSIHSACDVRFQHQLPYNHSGRTLPLFVLHQTLNFLHFLGLEATENIFLMEKIAQDESLVLVFSAKKIQLLQTAPNTLRYF